MKYVAAVVCLSLSLALSVFAVAQEVSVSQLVIAQLKAEKKIALSLGNTRKAAYIDRLIAEQKQIIGLYQ